MTGYVVSPRAQADLDEIWNYSAQQWGEDRAERYIRELWQGIKHVAADPRRARPCDEIRAGYHKYSVAEHILFLRLTTDGIDVVRILHSHMDFEQRL